MYFSDDQISYSPRYVLTVSMGMLSIAHIHRQITDYGGYTLDFTGYDNMSLISYYKLKENGSAVANPGEGPGGPPLIFRPN